MSLFVDKYQNDGSTPDRYIQSEIRNTQLFVRINGTLPNLSTVGDEEKSERAAEVKKMNIAANTSCSVFKINPSHSKDSQDGFFHLLVDIGEGIVKSLEAAISDIASTVSVGQLSPIPNALLITHSHDDHVMDLPDLLNKVKAGQQFNVYCTRECYDQLIGKFPQITENQKGFFNLIMPGESFRIGSFSITPILVDHGENSPTGSVIYIVGFNDTKMIFGWDFLSLLDADERVLWNPDLLILGTQSYNPHPKETGMISVTDAYQLVRRWNAKNCYLVHYRGLTDIEESKNQWFKGPVKPMTTHELQKNVDSHLAISGDNGRFNITVAKEGMIWAPKEPAKPTDDENIPVGNIIDVEGQQKYVFRMERESKEDKLRLTIEDSINRYTLQFDRPRKDKNNDRIVRAEGERGMLATGPELIMELVMPDSKEREIASLTIAASKGKSSMSTYLSKGKKYVFRDEIELSEIDAQRLKKYFEENFVTGVK